MCCLPNKIIIIAAVSKNGIIGDNGQIPWHSKEELNFFKETTFGFPVVMGRKTFESLNKPLIGRENIILSRDEKFKLKQNCLVFHSILEVISYCEKIKNNKCFIIGGGEIFEQTIKVADKLIISQMNFNCKGDVLFPEIDKNKWNLTAAKPYKEFIVNYYAKVKS